MDGRLACRVAPSVFSDTGVQSLHKGEAARSQHLTASDPKTLSRRAGRDHSFSRRQSVALCDTAMTRVRYDPGFLSSPMWERLGVDAYVLHTQACAYVVHTLSDGFVSEARALTLTPLVRKPKQAVKALVDEGVWTAVDGGYQVCDCHDNLRLSVGRGDEQPSRAQVDGEREKGRLRQEKWRANRVSNGVTNGVSNRVGNTVRNGDQCSAVQCDAVQEPPVPVPALLADDDPEAVCEHGTPNGKLLTTAGDKRCPMCRRLTLVPQESA